MSTFRRHYRASAARIGNVCSSAGRFVPVGGAIS